MAITPPTIKNCTKRILTGNGLPPIIRVEIAIFPHFSGDNKGFFVLN